MPFPSAYMQLYNASALAVKSVDPSYKVGGPATAQRAGRTAICCRYWRPH